MRKQPNRFMEPLEGRTLYSAAIYGTVHHDVIGDGRVDENATVPALSAYLDLNNNGRRDKFEPSAKVDANGRYAFTNVPIGQYHVLLDIPKGFVASNAAARVGQMVQIYGTGTFNVPMMMIHYAGAPWPTVGQNAQHTGVSPFRAAPLDNKITVADLNLGLTSTDGVQYGTPVVTNASRSVPSVVIVPSVVNGRYILTAYNWQVPSKPLWTYTSNYVPPSTGGPQSVFSPALSPNGKLYFPGGSGQILEIANPNFNYNGSVNKHGQKVKVTPKSLFFYPEKQFRANPVPFQSSLFVNTPITFDAKGNLYFGVYSTGAANNPAHIGSSFVRMTPSGKARTAAVTAVTGRAPALSNDGRYVYVVTQTQGGTPALQRLNAATLAGAGAANLVDPVTNTAVTTAPNSTASPVIAPDGDVYLAVPANDPVTAGQTNGWILRFSADLKTTKGSTAAVANQTPSIVPASMVSGYQGKSGYLLAATKVNPDSVVYTITDPGQDENTPADELITHPFTYNEFNQTLSLFDPANGLSVFVSGLHTSQIQVGADPATNNPFFVPGAWVSNAVVVDPSSGSIYAVDSSDHMYRWNLSDPVNVTKPLALIDGSSSPDTSRAPLAIGPEGEIYAIAGGSLIAVY